MLRAMTLAGLATIADAHASLLKPAPRVSTPAPLFQPRRVAAMRIGLAH